MVWVSIYTCTLLIFESVKEKVNDFTNDEPKAADENAD